MYIVAKSIRTFTGGLGIAGSHWTRDDMYTVDSSAYNIFGLYDHRSQAPSADGYTGEKEV